MQTRLKSVLGIAGILVATQAAAQVTFYESEGLRGRAFSADREIDNFQRFGFNDRAASVVVDSGWWQVCEDAQFQGRCVVLRPGRYDSLASMNLNYQISSVRPVENDARYDNGRSGYAVAQGYDTQRRSDEYQRPNDAYQRRNDEQLFEANVTSAHAVVGNAQQRCWIDRENVTTDNGRGSPNIGGAIAGAVIGGILGHQIGSGRGNDVATAAGAVGGAAVGSNVGRDRDGGQVYSQDVQRCTNVDSQARPDYWDVTYNFRGQEHRAQLNTPPGSTITVNRSGEPRVY